MKQQSFPRPGLWAPWVWKYRARRIARRAKVIASFAFFRYKAMTWLAGGRPTIINCVIAGTTPMDDNYIYFNNRIYGDIDDAPAYPDAPKCTVIMINPRNHD